MEKIIDTILLYSKCYKTNHYDWWVSIYGKVFCYICHPPARPGLVLFRIRNAEDLGEWKKTQVIKIREIYYIEK